jgi:hypothetical protein
MRAILLAFEEDTYPCAVPGDLLTMPPEQPMSDEVDHGRVVDAWLDRSAAGLAPEQVVELLEATLGALLARTETTLGELTLAVIADRVLHNTVERYPAFAPLTFASGKGVRCDELRAHAGAVPAGELRAGVRFVLVELLTVLGNLTAEILSPELHAELSKTTPPGDKRP